MKLHLWCWTYIKPWYVNIDILPLPWVDIVHNLENVPYPFEDNSVDLVFSSHVLEHIQDLWAVMEELTRIGKNWSIIQVVTPYFSNPGTWADYTHRRWFTTRTFDYFHPDFLYNHGARVIVKKIRIHFFRNRWIYMNSAFINILRINKGCIIQGYTIEYKKRINEQKEEILAYFDWIRL